MFAVMDGVDADGEEVSSKLVPRCQGRGLQFVVLCMLDGQEGSAASSCSEGRGLQLLMLCMPDAVVLWHAGAVSGVDEGVVGGVWPHTSQGMVFLSTGYITE